MITRENVQYCELLILLTQFSQKQMNQDETHKWSCTTCSYANWPLARKCTLCLTPKESVIDVEKGKVKAEIIQPPSNKWTCKVISGDP